MAEPVPTPQPMHTRSQGALHLPTTHKRATTMHADSSVETAPAPTHRDGARKLVERSVPAVVDLRQACTDADSSRRKTSAKNSCVLVCNCIAPTPNPRRAHRYTCSNGQHTSHLTSKRFVVLKQNTPHRQDGVADSDVLAGQQRVAGDVRQHKVRAGRQVHFELQVCARKRGRRGSTQTIASPTSNNDRSAVPVNNDSSAVLVNWVRDGNCWRR
jgi:hypothetical protein